MESWSKAMEQRSESEQVKDAYSAWLKELYADPALQSGANAKRMLRKKKKKRKVPTVHALQPTQSSLLKHIATRKSDEQSQLPLLTSPANPEALQDAKYRRYRALSNAANFVENEYGTLYQPGLAFWQLLAEQVLRVNVDSSGPAYLPNFPLDFPATLLRYCKGGHTLVQVMFLYTKGSDAADRVLCVQHFATEKQFQSQRASILHLFSSSGQLNEGPDIRAVRKSADGTDCRSNRIQLIKTEEELLQQMDAFWRYQTDCDDNQTDVATYCAIQKFVSCKGNSHSGHRNAWIARPVCRNKELTSIWIITSASRVHDTDITNSMDEASCQIVKCATAQSWQEPRLLATTFKYMLEKLLPITLTELVLDLLQDSDGRWWLLQVKAFQHRTSGCVPLVTATLMSRANSAPNRLETLAPVPGHGEKRWRCAGKYCSRSDNNRADSLTTQPPELEPSGFLMKKIMLSCEFFDRCFVSPLQDMSLMSGFPDFSAALEFHLQHQTNKRDRNQFYESQPVCSKCLAQYHKLREQWMTSVNATKTPVNTSKSSSAALRIKKDIASSNLEQSLVPRNLPSLDKYPTDKLSSLLVAGGATQIALLPRPLQTTNETPSYLDEMKSVERVLSQVGLSSGSDAESLQTQTPEQPKPSPEHLLQSHKDSEAQLEYSSLFHTGGVSRVEAMWQSLSFNATFPAAVMARRPTEESASLHPGPQYNSFTLVDGMNIIQQPIASSPCRIPSAVSAPSEALPAVPVHRIPIHDCRKLFYDDSLREQLVTEASSMLLVRSTAVCFEITSSATEREQDDESLADLLLRSLFLDLSQAISSRSAAPWRRRMPAIARDANGHAVLTITPC